MQSLPYLGFTSAPQMDFLKNKKWPLAIVSRPRCFWGSKAAASKRPDLNGLIPVEHRLAHQRLRCLGVRCCPYLKKGFLRLLTLNTDLNPTQFSESGPLAAGDDAIPRDTVRGQEFGSKAGLSLPPDIRLRAETQSHKGR